MVYSFFLLKKNMIQNMCTEKKTCLWLWEICFFFSYHNFMPVGKFRKKKNHSDIRKKRINRDMTSIYLSSNILYFLYNLIFDPFIPFDLRMTKFFHNLVCPYFFIYFTEIWRCHQTLRGRIYIYKNIHGYIKKKQQQRLLVCIIILYVILLKKK